MAYTSDLPKPTDRPSDSQSLMRANSNEIATFNAVNHVAFNDASGKQGMHKWASFPTQGAPSGSYPTTAATDIAIFSQTSEYSAATELAIRKQADGSVYEFTAAGKASPGWAILPSGILIKWVYDQVSLASFTTTYTWPVAANIPEFSSVFSCNVSVVSGVGNDNAATLIGKTNQVVTLYGTHRTTNVYRQVHYSIFAIGLTTPKP